MRIRKRQPDSPTIYNSSTRRKHSILLFSNDPTVFDLGYLGQLESSLEPTGRITVQGPCPPSRCQACWSLELRSLETPRLSTPRRCFCPPTPLSSAMPPASLLGSAPPRVQKMLQCQSRKSLPRTASAIFVRDPEPVRFELAPVLHSTPSSTRCTVTKDNPASIRPSHGPRRHSATPQVRGLCGIAPLSKPAVANLDRMYLLYTVAYRPPGR